MRISWHANFATPLSPARYAFPATKPQTGKAAPRVKGCYAGCQRWRRLKACTTATCTDHLALAFTAALWRGGTQRRGQGLRRHRDTHGQLLGPRGRSSQSSAPAAHQPRGRGDSPEMQRSLSSESRPMTNGRLKPELRARPRYLTVRGGCSDDPLPSRA